MHRIDGPGATVDNKFTEGDPVGGVQATVVTDVWLNDVQENIMAVLAAAGVTPTKGRAADLNDAIKKVSSGRLLNIQKFTSSGTYTPTPGMVFCIVKVQGAGGGGAGSVATGAAYSLGSGGASGSYAEVKFAAADIGLSKAITIGAAGPAGIGGPGVAGGDTSFGSLIVAPGGKGGISTAQVTGGGQAVISGGDPGALPTIAAGQTLVSTSGIQGGIGYAAAGTQRGGFGAGAPINGGGGGAGTSLPADAAGKSAQCFGSGGGGSFTDSAGAAKNGGPGFGGMVEILEFA